MSSTPKTEEPKKSRQDSFLTGFLAGALGACMSEAITIPLDTAKVRMMLYGMSGKYATVTSSLKTIQTEQGLPRLWKGLCAALMRQCVFAGIKLSLYEPIRNSVCSSEEEKLSTPLIKKIFAGIVSGGIACFFASPFDLVKIRMQDANKSKLYKGIKPTFQEIFLLQEILKVVL